jgi:hypothetical protein
MCIPEGARTTTPMSPCWTAWLGKSKKDWPPSPCKRTLIPLGPWAPGSAAAPGTPEAVVNWSAGAEILNRRSRPLGNLVSQFSDETRGLAGFLLDFGGHVQDHGAIGRLGDALRDGSCLLLRRLSSLAIATTVPVASFPSTVLWHALNLTEDGEEGHESKTNGQHSAEDTSPQDITRFLRREVDGKRKETEADVEATSAQFAPNDKIEKTSKRQGQIFASGNMQTFAIKRKKPSGRNKFEAASTQANAQAHALAVMAAAVSLDNPRLLAFQARPGLLWCSAYGDAGWLRSCWFRGGRPAKSPSPDRLCMRSWGGKSWDEVVEAPFWRYTASGDRS